ncbi:hypothetical protein HY639_01665 [Candidatus Woesearchaeota archaeon]|nr:hypothetical protein [Candidatus Woesearchaeota archaeon]
MTENHKTSVRPKDYNLRSIEERLFFEKLEAFEAPFLEEKLLDKGVFQTQQDYQIVFSEFKKYVALIKTTGQSIPMTSKAVDEVWHQFILFTREYHAFCDDMFGRYIHHAPATRSQPVAKADNFFFLYQSMYGPMPAVWTEKEWKRKRDSRALDRHQAASETKENHCSYDCWNSGCMGHCR